MSGYRLALTELRRLTAGRLPRVALVAVALVPLLYGALYLYANQDPFEQLDGVPAAVVVDDTGASRQGTEPLRAGEKIERRLIESNDFDWQPTSLREAQLGVASERYLFALVIPKDFSTALVSPTSVDPRQARLRMITNDTNNFLGSTIADRVAATVRAAVVRDVGTEAIDRLLTGLTTVHDKTMQAANGATTLADGTTRLRDGLGTAHDGATRLADGAHRLGDGQAALLDGTTRLAGGTATLADGADRLHAGTRLLGEKTAPLPEKTDQLADGAERVADGNERLADRVELIRVASQQVADSHDAAYQRVADRLRASGLDEQTIAVVLDGMREADAPFDRATDRIATEAGQLRTLADGSRQVARGARTLADATPAMTGAIGSITDGSGQLASGAHQLDAGAGQLLDGQRRAHEGGQALATGADAMLDGTQRLSDGSGTLDQGAHTLADKLGTGADGIPHPDEAGRKETARAVGDPVAVDTHNLAKAQNYAAGLAPFFLSLALWIGAFVIFMVVRPMSARALAADARPWSVAMGGWLPAAMIGTAQAVLLYAAVTLGVGITPAHPAAMLGLLVLTSWAFVAIVHALNAAFGPRGRFLALIVLVLQLVSSGGTFPWQTTPEILHPLHHVLPMAHVVTGLRRALYGGPAFEQLPASASVLVLYLVAGLALTSVAAWRQRMWTPARLVPELTL